MNVYDNTIFAFIGRLEEMMKEILLSMNIMVNKKTFLFYQTYYPINIVVFEGSDLGYFSAPFYEIGINKKLIYQAKDSVIRDVLKHEIAHYITKIVHGDVMPHGPEFRSICQHYGFDDDIAHAKMNLEDSNLSKQGDLEAERVLEKVKKLLQLAQSSNAHEAEVATMKANALLLRHNLDRFHAQNDDEPFYIDRVLIRKRKESKHTTVAQILKHFLVKPIINTGSGACCIKICGSLTNIKLAIYIADFLDKEIDRLWAQAQMAHGLKGLRAKNSFILGVAKGFDLKMRLSKNELSAADQRSLIKVEADLNEKTRRALGPLSTTSSSNQPDWRARSLGEDSGMDLTIRQGVESSSKGLYLEHINP
jgi:hypothetical protein